ncbi:UNVERIFIED_CONTAM: hypothetical protein Sradi_4900300 [Sesamum radiatum]|uniref:Uncharacterized protein n=1 Tax=Sesamum radiatum TaxID=300843 RepID=A0AAW2MF37_SESRA
MSKEIAGHEEALRKAVEKATLKFPHTDEDRNFLEGYWASRVDGFKRSDEYRKKVVKIAIPFLDYSFKACKGQFLAQGYPPTGEEPSFLDIGVAMVNAPNPFASPPTPMESSLPLESGNFLFD